MKKLQSVDTTIKDIAGRLKPLFDRNNVEKAILFGSLARGTASRRSDLDIAIVMKTRKRFLDRYDQFNEIFSILPGTAIDMLIYTPEELEAILHRRFIKQILDEGVIVYER